VGLVLSTLPLFGCSAGTSLRRRKGSRLNIIMYKLYDFVCNLNDIHDESLIESGEAFYALIELYGK
jgi:hypothetical protein